MTKNILLCILALVPVLAAQTETANTTPVASHPGDGISNELGQAILNELHQIRTLLEKQQQTAPPPAADPAKLSSAGFSMGKADAPLTLVEFADYQCPYCRQFHSTVYDQLKKNYIDTGKVRFVSRDLPLDFHSNAFAAAHASRCAADQNKFWEMRDTLISHADKLDDQAIAGYAETLGLNMEHFRSCVATGKYTASIRADMAEANAAGIQGTPAFVLGKTSAAGIQGVKLMGAQPYEAFEKAVTEQSGK